MERMERIEKVEPDAFVRDYIAKSRPVIVTDSMDTWVARRKWSPSYFRERFGNLNTQIYNNLFTLRNICSLREYIDQYFGKERNDSENAYARWYVKFKDVDFYWSDAVFEALKDEWSHPYFLPTTSYVMPLCRSPDTVLSHRNTFPYKGLFISSQGSRTRLHRDPFGTDAVLCQFYGTKQLTVYHPSEDGKLRRGKDFVDPLAPDLSMFPEFSTTLAIYEDELKSGEVLFIPSGWFHDVISLTDSISITWNFVHAANRDRFLQEVADPDNDFDRDMLEFFFKRDGASEEVSVTEITRLALSVTAAPGLA